MRKSKAGSEKCICETCPRRFECFTQERVFSDALLQGLFEAIIAEGTSREEAIRQVKEEIKFRLHEDVWQQQREQPQPWQPYKSPTTAPPWKVWYTSGGGESSFSSNVPSNQSMSNIFDNDYITFDHYDGNTGEIDVTYTMHSGKEYSFSANVSEL